MDGTGLDIVAERALTILLDESPSDADGAGTCAAPDAIFPTCDVAVDVKTRPLFLQAITAEALLEIAPDLHCVRVDRAIRQIAAARDAIALDDRYPIADRVEFPADAQELAQLLLLFARAGRSDLIARYCVPPLATLLPYAEADGIIPTWILPPAGRDPAEGGGAIADLFYAFARWDPRRFLGGIVAGARWVGTCQQPDGSWGAGPGTDRFYASWQALRLLGAVMPNHPAVPRAVAFLHNSRSPAGGWGDGAGDDPLATACALQALLAARTRPSAALVREAVAAVAPHLAALPPSDTVASRPLPGATVLAAGLLLRALHTLQLTSHQ
ncbi:prenyltransferase/squalene oxidase repeat-containing protein [Sphingomonas azotifigens]|uniref:prenyltransferase/squalene oxidase repeat-containing protein n=1 Tax=Sphingomonas azotifigens TaxID=330920 RepID=UPI0009FF7C6B|nr:prenyltransferase/squalene oxidase repeat-containing protein [Sphingomonas azotifigens]